MSRSYWCCIITRDGAETLGATIDSIMQQSVPPDFLVVVNDGSTDQTPLIIQEKLELYGKIHIIDTGSKTRDIRRVPALLNLGLGFSEKMPKTDYMMISGDDIELTKEYAQSMMGHLDADRKLVVASGEWKEPGGRLEAMPTGAGRFVRTSFMVKIGNRYPVAYGWEPWILYKAMELGYSVAAFPNERYNHLRPYRTINLFGWGRGMYSLGFSFYFVLLRFLINFIWSRHGTQSRKASVSMLVGYLSARISPDNLRGMVITDKGLKDFVKRYSITRISRVF